MRYIIFDVEATSWEEQVAPEKTEILEIGAVELASAGGAIVREFGSLVRPVGTPVISSFCLKNTGWTQHEIDQADALPYVLSEFLDWLGTEPLTLCTWGDYDLLQLQRDCQRHKLAVPDVLTQSLNLRRAFSNWQRVPPTGLGAALRHLELSRAGKPHSAPDDARSVARVARLMLPLIERGQLSDREQPQRRPNNTPPPQNRRSGYTRR